MPWPPFVLWLSETRLVQVLCGSSMKHDLFDSFPVLFFSFACSLEKVQEREAGEVELEACCICSKIHVLSFNARNAKIQSSY